MSSDQASESTPKSDSEDTDESSGSRTASRSHSPACTVTGRSDAVPLATENDEDVPCTAVVTTAAIATVTVIATTPDPEVLTPKEPVAVVPETQEPVPSESTVQKEAESPTQKTTDNHTRSHRHRASHTGHHRERETKEAETKDGEKDGNGDHSKDHDTKHHRDHDRHHGESHSRRRNRRYSGGGDAEKPRACQSPPVPLDATLVAHQTRSRASTYAGEDLAAELQMIATSGSSLKDGNEPIEQVDGSHLATLDVDVNASSSTAASTAPTSSAAENLPDPTDKTSVIPQINVTSEPLASTDSNSSSLSSLSTAAAPSTGGSSTKPTLQGTGLSLPRSANQGFLLSYFGKSEPGAHNIDIENVVQIAAHATRAAVLLLSDGTVVCLPNGPPACEIGKNQSRFLVNIPAPEPITQIACSTAYVCAIGASGKLYFCEDLMAPAPAFSFINLTDVVEVHVGSYGLFAAALQQDGTLWTWGADPPPLGAPTPKRVEVFYPAVSKSKVDPPPPQEQVIFKTFDCGDKHIAAVSDKGDVWIWGSNPHSCLIKECQDPIISTPQLALDKHKIAHISCGRNVTFASGEDGKIWFWGDPGNHILHPLLANAGYLGYQKPVVLGYLPGGVRISCGVNHYAALSETGDLWTWGSSDRAQLGYITQAVVTDSFVQDNPPQCVAIQVKQVVCGSSYTLMLRYPLKHSMDVLSAVTFAAHMRSSSNLKDSRRSAPPILNSLVQPTTTSTLSLAVSQLASTCALATTLHIKSTTTPVNNAPMSEEVISLFKTSPSKAIKKLLELGLITNAPRTLATYLFSNCDLLSPSSLADFLGSEGSEQVLSEFTNLINLSHLNFEMALRRFMWIAHLPGEAQKIDRMMSCFARHYLEVASETGMFKNSDAIYILAFSCIMLTTSFTKQQCGYPPPTMDKWISGNNDTEAAGLPRDFQEHLYNQIADTPFDAGTPSSKFLVMQGILSQPQRVFLKTTSCHLNHNNFYQGDTKIPLSTIIAIKQAGATFTIKLADGKDRVFEAKTVYTANTWINAFRTVCSKTTAITTLPASGP